MSRRLAPLFTLTALAATAPVLLGCTEQPVIEVRWGFVDDMEDRENGEEPTLDGVFECAASGVGQVQLRVLTEDGEFLVATRTHDCHPPSFSDPSKLARGPVIDTPGTYRLEVVGLRGNDLAFERRFEPTSFLGDVEPVPAPDAPPSYECEVREDTAIRTRIVEVLVDPDDPEKGTMLVEEREAIDYEYQYCVLAAWPPLDGSVDNRFTVDEDGNVDWVDFSEFDQIPLIRPIECDDGVDNDGDGLVDGGDLACQVSIENRESDDEGFTVIRALAGFFDSPLVTCTAVDAVKLFVRVKDADGEVVETFESESCVADDPTLQVGPLGRFLPPGDYSLEGEVTTTVNPPAFFIEPGCTPVDDPDCACDPNDENMTCEVIDPPPFQDVVTKTLEAGPFVVPENAGGVLVHEFNFDNDDWLEPFVTPLNVFFRLEDSPQGNLRNCPHSDSKIFQLDEVSVEYADNPEGNGPFHTETVECGGATPSVKWPGEDLSWAEAKYYVTAQATADGIACYELNNRLLGPYPGEVGQPVTLQRITNDDGSPVEGCEECFINSHCVGGIDEEDLDDENPPGVAATCVNGYCVPPSADGG